MKNYPVLLKSKPSQTILTFLISMALCMSAANASPRFYGNPVRPVLDTTPAKQSEIGDNLSSENIKPVTPDSAGKKNVEVVIEASFPGGSSAWLRYLCKNFRYPQEAQMGRIQGTVIVQFIVDIDGKISGAEAISGPTNGGLREECVKIIKNSGKWSPGIHNGVPVKSYKKQEITFRLESL